MNGRRSATDLITIVLLFLAVAITATAQVDYVSRLFALGYFHAGPSWYSFPLIPPYAPFLAFSRLSIGALLQFAGMVGIGIFVLARRRDRLAWLALSCIALALVEVDRVQFAVRERNSRDFWIDIERSQGAIPDSMQAMLGILVAVLLFLLLTGWIRAQWPALALLPLLVASAALQGRMVSSRMSTPWISSS